MRDAIFNKWGQCFDINFQPVTTFGFRELYLNVMPVCLGSRKFRHETELDYLCHLQAVVSTPTPTVPRYKNTCLHNFPITGLHGASSVQYHETTFTDCQRHSRRWRFWTNMISWIMFYSNSRKQKRNQELTRVLWWQCPFDWILLKMN